jgi:hypothetical protein
VPAAELVEIPDRVLLDGIGYINSRGESLLVMPSRVSPFEVEAAKARVRGEIMYRNLDRYTEAIIIVGLLLAVGGILIGFWGVRSWL